MIIFYGDDFELNLTTLKITFIKENALFYNAFFKNYTLPFTLPMDEETSQKLGLIDVENTSGYKVKHFGKLFLDTYFEDAYLFIEVEDGNIQGNIAFGQLTLPIMETKLSALPFPLIKTNSINEWAKSITSKKYPEVSHCFPMVFDDKFSSENNYKAFEGVVNNVSSTNFVVNQIDGVSGEVLNKNIVVPYPYIMGILKLGFASAGYDLIGDFASNQVNNYLVLDPKKHLETFSTATYDYYQFKQPNDEYLDNGILIYEYNKTHTLSIVGSYNLKALLNLPKEVVVKQLLIKRGAEVLYSGVGNVVNEKININKQTGTSETVTVKLLIESTTVSIENYNNFEFEKSEGKLNTFKNSFSLAEFMLDITFGALLNKIKNWLNLQVVLSDSYVRIDYIEKKFVEVNFKDETSFEIKNPKRQFNQAKVYKLKYSDENFILIDKTGRVNTTQNYREEDIVVIDMNLEVLKVESRNNIFSAVRSDNDFSLLLYNGPDANGNPVAVEKADGLTFKLQEIYELYWKNWLNYRTNSETYTDKFETHALEDFKINEGRFKYNKKHLYKTIKQTRVSETQWDVDIESESF